MLRSGENLKIKTVVQKDGNPAPRETIKYTVVNLNNVSPLDPIPDKLTSTDGSAEIVIYPVQIDANSKGSFSVLHEVQGKEAKTEVEISAAVEGS